MASITLAEASKLGLDDLVEGVIENIVTVNPIYQVLPFQDIEGNAKTYNRENALGDTQVAGIGGTISAKAAPTFTKLTTNLTTIIGDAEINGLLQAQRVGGDLVAQQIASKAKSVGRRYQHMMINGENGSSTIVQGTSPTFAYDAEEFDGIRKLMPVGQVTTVSGGISFTRLDELLHAVKSKDGQVDWIQMNSRTIRSYMTLVRALGGTTGDWVELSPGVRVPTYAGIPIFRNDYIPTDLDNSGGTGSATDTVVLAGNFDDGSEKVGISGLTSSNNMGVHVQSVGASEDKDEDIYRVKFYSSMAMYSGLSVAMLDEISN